MKTKNILIASGCMAVQDKSKGNIDYQLLYHQVLKLNIAEKNSINLDYQILRTERFSMCLQKLKKSFSNENTDLIIFQVRGHPYLQLIKLFGFYIHSSTKKRSYTFNLLKWRESMFEKHLQIHPKSISNTSLKHKPFLLAVMKILKSIYSRNIFNYINYSVGKIIGNERRAYRIYIDLINDVIEFANYHQVPIIFIGVTSRPNNKTQDRIAEKLNEKVSGYLLNKNLTYVDIFGKFTKKGRYKFDKKKKISLNDVGIKNWRINYLQCF